MSFFFRFPRADRREDDRLESPLTLSSLSRPRVSLFLSSSSILTSRSAGRDPPAPALFRSAFSTRETSASAVIGDDDEDDQFPPPAAAVVALAASSQSARRLRPREDASKRAAAACEEAEAKAIVFPC